MYFVCTKWPVNQDDIRTRASWASQPGRFEYAVSLLGTGALFPPDTTPQRQDVGGPPPGSEHWGTWGRTLKWELSVHRKGLLTGSTGSTPQCAYQRFLCRPPCLSHLNSCPKFLKTCSVCSSPIILSPWTPNPMVWQSTLSCSPTYLPNTAVPHYLTIWDS